MKILVVSPDYPTSKTIDFVFVDQLCRAFTDEDVEVVVVAPQTLTKCILRNIPISKYKTLCKLDSGKCFTLYRPKYLSVGNAKGILKNHNKNAFNAAVYRVLSAMKIKPDAFYGHFWQSAKALIKPAEKFRIPLFVASGEEVVSLERIECKKIEAEHIKETVRGVINVSSDNKRQCVLCGIENEDNGIVVPNAVDNTIFKVLNKHECRMQIGIKDDDFVVCFVGQMNDRKGPLRVSEALKLINDDHIKAFFLGSGVQTPDYNNIIFSGTLPHNQLPIYLNASDVFVLPTLNEGCCNAIVEAISCGLPVISSDLPFNYDVLNDANSILIDPMDISKISEAILSLKNNKELLMRKSKSAVESAETLTLKNRARIILGYIKDRM